MLLLLTRHRAHDHVHNLVDVRQAIQKSTIALSFLRLIACNHRVLVPIIYAVLPFKHRDRFTALNTSPLLINLHILNLGITLLDFTSAILAHFE